MQLRLGKYELIGRIGQGGQGTVYRARDTELDRSETIAGSIRSQYKATLYHPGGHYFSYQLHKK